MAASPMKQTLVAGKRNVRWRRSQLRAFAIGALLCLLVAAVVGAGAYYKGKQKIEAQNQTILTKGTITRRWRTGDGPSARYWVGFRFPELAADQPDQVMEIHRLLDWLQMNPGMQFVTSVVPDAPEANGMTLHKPMLFQRWLLTGGVASVLVVLLPFWIFGRGWRRKRREYWLVHRGQSAVAEITNVIETMIRKGEGARWDYQVEYRFMATNGRRVVGNRVESRSDRQFWDLGGLVTVFYDARNPERHALYIDLPAEVVSAAH